jgi:serine/threonine protein kinase
VVHRASFFRAVMAQTVLSLGTLHRAGVCHGSIGASSIFLSTADLQNPRSVRVQLGDLGFCTTAMKQADFVR